MRLRHLRYFAAVAEARHLSRAATALHVAQPALSRQIHDLERELGVPLLDRHSRGVAPTAAGEVLARGSVQLLVDIALAFDRAESAAAGRSGKVVIGLPRVALVRGIAAALDRALRERHPDITLVVREIDGVQAWDLVASGELDLGVGTTPPTESPLSVEPVWEDVVNRALIPATHELAGRKRVRAAELSGLPLFVPPRGLPAHLLQSLIAQLTAAGLRSPLLTLDTGLAGAQLMVAAGRGWILMSEAMSKGRPSGTATPLLEGFHLPIPVVVGWRRNERRQVARVVIELTLEFARGTEGSRVREAPELPPASPMRTTRRRKPGSMPVEVEFRHLRALLEVAAVQSIGRAAERLGVTQPALSRQLQELERSLGFALLHRGARGVSLTAGGTALASECPGLLGSLERLTRETTRARRGMEGHCRVGAVTTVAASDLLGTVLTHCAVRHPQLNIVIDEIPTPKQPAALRQGKIDLGLLHASPASDASDHFLREQVYSDHIDVALLSPAHPLADRAEVTGADLATVPFLFMARAFQPPLYDLVMASLGEIGLVPLVKATYDGLPTVWTIAAQGWGWCLGFRSHVARPPAGTVAVRIRDLDIPWGLDIIWRKDERSAAVRAVIEAFRSARVSEAARDRAGRTHRRRSGQMDAVRGIAT